MTIGSGGTVWSTSPAAVEGRVTIGSGGTVSSTSPAAAEGRVTIGSGGMVPSTCGGSGLLSSGPWALSRREAET